MIQARQQSRKQQMDSFFAEMEAKYAEADKPKTKGKGKAKKKWCMLSNFWFWFVGVVVAKGSIIQLYC